MRGETRFSQWLNFRVFQHYLRKAMNIAMMMGIGRLSGVLRGACREITHQRNRQAGRPRIPRPKYSSPHVRIRIPLTPLD